MPDRPVVVTVVHGRHDHLRAQRRLLALCTPPPSCHVVVAMGDEQVEAVLDELPELPTRLVAVDATIAGLPVAAARNAGARAALDAGASLLIFLDVDCLPSASLVGDYAAALADRAGAVVCGPVTYLPPAPPAGWEPHTLAAERAPHPARPDPSRGSVVPIGPALFWSLSFALTASTWERLGGFYEGYVGYGGEDTDVGFGAAAQGVELLFLGGADAFHQYHPVSDPPVEHVTDIVRNARIFHRRHGELPMTGWLTAFVERGLIEQVDGLPRGTDAVRLLTVPAHHPYLDAALPPTVVRVDPTRVIAWEPDPLLDAAAFDARVDDVDVVHVHFGYEHLSLDALRDWLDVLDRRGVPLVVTVHDLHNPHLADQRYHEAQLALLVARAAGVVTVTAAAAVDCTRRFERRVDVVPHPTLIESMPHTRRRNAVLVPLKALRANVIGAVRIVETVADATGCTRVLLDPAASAHPDYDAVVALGTRPDVEVVVAGHRPHDEVVAEVAAARALVLPYAFGTHSGWIELARDVGTPVVAPRFGGFADQWAGVRGYDNDVDHGLDAPSLACAVRDAVADHPGPASRTARLAERDVVRAMHEAIYRAVLVR